MGRLQQEAVERALSFGYAFEGIWLTLRTQKNAWIHALATVLVLVFGFWLGISRIEWTILILAMGTVWAGECINTALESVVDMTSPDPHPLAKAAKDAAAGAVLISAIAAATIGFMILGPPLWIVLQGWFS